MIVNITATLGTRGQVLQVHAGSAKAAVGMGAPSVCLPGFLPVPGGQQCTNEAAPPLRLGHAEGRAAVLLPHTACLPRRCNDAGFPGDSVVKNLPANLGDVGSIPVLARSPGAGNDNLLQYSCLENPWTEEPGGPQSMGPQRVGHD